MDAREFQLERWFAKHEFSAKHLLSSSDCEAFTVGELLALAGAPLERLASLRLGYTESQGDPELRARIAGFYPGLDADDIVVTNAPEEAIFLFALAALEPGDRVVVQTPCYQSLFELAAWRGCEVVPWPMVETDDGWRFDLERLPAPARAIILNAPHNPTGALPSLADFEAVVALADRLGARLFCDEMYRGLEHDPAARLPPAASRSERAVSLWGLSKTFGLPGLRIGWLALRDRALRDAIVRWKDYTTICSSAPGELLAKLALEHHAAIERRNLAIVDENLRLARAFAARHPDVLAWREPRAGSIGFSRLVRGGAQAFCDAAVEGCGALLVPSTVFDWGDAHVRLGFGRRGFAEGLAALESWLAAQSRGT